MNIQAVFVISVKKKRVIDNMVFEKAWSIVKIDDSDCEAVWDLTDSHGLTLGEAVHTYARITGLSTRERAQLKDACMEYMDAGKYESANLAERMRDD